MEAGQASQELRDYLRSHLPATLGSEAEVVAVHRRRSEYSSSYPTDVVTVDLDNGESHVLFVKDFGSTSFPKDAARQRRERELAVYRDLLSGTDLGTAAYRGAVWDESRNRFWLLLEWVDGREVRQCEVDDWVAAVGWLGRLAGHFASRVGRLRARDDLVRHDGDLFRSRAELARREVGEVDASLPAVLEPVLEVFDRVVDAMTEQPRTLVHGAYRPCNVLIGAGSPEPRICPVDWELAGVGSSLFDLAFFSDGFEPPVLDRMFDAYRDQAGRAGVRLDEPAVMRHVVDCFRLFRVVNWLGRARERGFSAAKVATLVERGRELARVVG